MSVAVCRTLIYLEADAKMQSYDDRNGEKQSSLNLVQTKLEVMKRPVAREEGEGEGNGSFGV